MNREYFTIVFITFTSIKLSIADSASFASAVAIFSALSDIFFADGVSISIGIGCVIVGCDSEAVVAVTVEAAAIAATWGKLKLRRATVVKAWTCSFFCFFRTRAAATNQSVTSTISFSF